MRGAEARAAHGLAGRHGEQLGLLGVGRESQIRRIVPFQLGKPVLGENFAGEVCSDRTVGSAASNYAERVRVAPGCLFCHKNLKS